MTKPSEEVETMSDATPEESKPKGIKHAKLTAIIIAVIVVALAGIGGGYAYCTHREATAYHAAVAQAEAADKALSKTVDEAMATEYKADQLKEPKLLDKLDGAIRKAKALKGVPEDHPGEWLAWQLASAKQANATDADEANAQAKALDAALKAVKDSKLAKELDTAKAQLKQGIDSASRTLKDTEGKVADNATRDSLTKAINEANKTINKKDASDPKAYTDAKAKLDAAVKQVNDSKAAKEQADAEAAAKAQAEAEAQAQAQAAAQSQRSYSKSSTRGYSSSKSYTAPKKSYNRGYSAPQRSYTAPKQSAPAPSNNGGGSSNGGDSNGGGCPLCIVEGAGGYLSDGGASLPPIVH
ncbi:FIVAR domain-containing protein [Bifidobacterium boum]|uniref:FIVAR domain-containing protein n=1 Tax=Bifidobacterium boum TaxID=78343 RepID=UPI001F2D8377|nr:FIVAR domain-containing protein [Bifidobacterium boum]